MGKQRRPETAGETATNQRLGAIIYSSQTKRPHGPHDQALLDFLRVFQDTPSWDKVWSRYDRIRKWRKNEEPHIEAEAQKEGIAPDEWRAKVCLTKLRKFVRSQGLHLHRVFNADDRHKMGLPADGDEQARGKNGQQSPAGVSDAERRILSMMATYPRKAWTVTGQDGIHTAMTKRPQLKVGEKTIRKLLPALHCKGYIVSEKHRHTITSQGVEAAQTPQDANDDGKPKRKKAHPLPTG